MSSDAVVPVQRAKITCVVRAAHGDGRVKLRNVLIVRRPMRLDLLKRVNSIQHLRRADLLLAEPHFSRRHLDLCDFHVLHA